MIRRAQERDFRELVKLSEEYHKEHWFGEHTGFDPEYTFENFRACTVGIQANVLVAECNEHGLVGYSVAFLVPLQWSPQLRCTIAYSYLRPDHRKTGLFEEMVQAHTDWASQHKCVDINLGDGAQYGAKFATVANGLGFDHTGVDSYKVLYNE